MFFIWGSTTCLSVLFTYFFVSETKGLSLEQVDQMLVETSPRTSTGWKPSTTWAGAQGKVAVDHAQDHKESGEAQSV